MNANKSIEEQLWDYIDGITNKEENSFIEDLLATDERWRIKYHELTETHKMMKEHIELDMPSMRFTANVMDQIAKMHIAPAAKSYINKNIIKSIAAFFLIMIVGFLIYGFAQVNWSSSGGSNIALPFDFSKIAWGKIFNNTYANIFIMINIVLGLMLFDMYLTRKKEKAKHKEA